jgi:hypothetical protein
MERGSKTERGREEGREGEQLGGEKGKEGRRRTWLE